MEVIRRRDVFRIEPVPNGRKRRRIVRVAQPVGLAAVEIRAVGEGGAEDAAHVVIAHGVLADRTAIEVHVPLLKIADRQDIAARQARVRGEQETVHCAIGEMHATSVIGVVRICVAAGVKTKRCIRRKREGRLGLAEGIDELAARR